MSSKGIVIKKWHSQILISSDKLSVSVLTRLTTKWDYLTQLQNDSSRQDEDSTDTMEVLEEKLNSHITREYTDLLKICLLGGSAAAADDQPDSMEQDEMDVGPQQRFVILIVNRVNQPIAATLMEITPYLSLNIHNSTV